MKLKILITCILLLPSYMVAKAQDRYVVIVANNHSLDQGVAPLRFADDDGARYFELFQASGAKVALFAVLDPTAQKRFPDAARAAKEPKRNLILKTIQDTFLEMQQAENINKENHFYFIYTGHGQVGANREGYIHFSDARFRRSELYRLMLSRSTASYNHLIIDACHAYYFVHKRGSQRVGNYQAAVNDFLKTEEIVSYPNTGVILAASSESETHEWGHWEAGIFSHELRSALIGAADINGDGKLTYAEVAGCVEAANSSILDPKARLQVHYQAPASDFDIPLMTLSSLKNAPPLRLEQKQAGRYFIEDARGVRVADLHFSNEQSLELRLIGNPPFWLRTNSQEAKLIKPPYELNFKPRAHHSRGSIETSFKKHLYQTAFGYSFHQGMLAALFRPRQDQQNIIIKENTKTRGENLLVLPVSFKSGGQQDDSLPQSLSLAMQETARQLGGYQVVQASKIDAVINPTTLACLGTQDCALRLGLSKAVTKVLSAVVNHVGDSYHLKLTLNDTGVQQELQQESMSIRGRRQLLVPTVRHLTGLILGASDEPGNLRVSLSVQNARLTIDGEEIDPERLQDPISLPPGKHLLAAEAQGYQTFLEEVVLPTRETVALNIELKKQSDSRPRPMRSWGWRSLGMAGLVAAGGGGFYGWAHAIHDDYIKSDDILEAKQLKQKAEDRQLVGHVLMGVAGALVVTSITLFILDSQEPADNLQLTPTLTIDNNSFSAGFCFGW
jgi:hypothetical protein